MLAAFRLGSRRCPRISGHRTGVGTRRQSRIRSLGPAARWCSSVTAGHARCSRPSGWPSAARSRRTCLLMETFRLPRGLAAAGSTCCERHRRRWPTSSRPCSLPAEASPPGATRICARRSPTNDCARELWRRSVRSRASSGRRPCPRSPAGRTRPVVISNSVPLCGGRRSRAGPGMAIPPPPRWTLRDARAPRRRRRRDPRARGLTPPPDRWPLSWPQDHDLGPKPSESARLEPHRQAASGGADQAQPRLGSGIGLAQGQVACSA
jgi:hypothetical protein